MRHSRTWGRSWGHRGSGSRRGFTLIEMMIALVITLMIVFAMVEAFRWVGETTTDGRASIEMLGQIRHARFRLEDDLSRCTASLAPWGANAGLSQGYVELVEGAGSDSVPSRYLARTRTSPSNLTYQAFDFADPDDLMAGQSASLFGDVDDILMFTVRNDDVPFRGRYNGVIIESNLAEIIWWVELNDQAEDLDGDGVLTPPNDANSDGIIRGSNELGEDGYLTWQPGETFTIRRRVLLIRPDLNVSGVVTSLQVANPPNVTSQDIRNSFNTFLQQNDISVRLHYDSSNKPDGLAANSLDDLSYRHNRTAHEWIDYSIVNGAGTARGLSAGNTLAPVDPSRLPAFTATDLIGEDVVLTNVLSFDMRVWDPHIAVTNYEVDAGDVSQEGIVPGDAAYANRFLPLKSAPKLTIYGGNVVGRGAFIDLGALAGDLTTLRAAHESTNQIDDDNDGTRDPSVPPQMSDPPIDPSEMAIHPIFSGSMQPNSITSTGATVLGNFVYDPWSLNYESDGFDQDGDGTADEGTNGLDDDSKNGPDDLSERETSPPYPYPLKSIQVRIRMYEPDTRQVRQASQVVKFRTE